MRSAPLFHEKRLIDGNGSIAVAEIKIWRVPESADYPTGRKFSLFFVVDGNVVVGIDNHKPKGPHLHLDGREHPYRFNSVDELIEDFWVHVRKAGFEP